MHVASLVFVGGGCENLTEKLAVGVVGLTSGGAPQRATNYSICKNLLLECTLGCPLHVQEGDRDVQSPEEICSSRVSVSSKSYTRGHVDALRSLLMLLARCIQ